MKKPRRGGGGGGGGDRPPALRKGPWTAEEDEVLRRHVREHGPQEWSSIRSKGLLPRTGKSCRLRWVNKLRPNLKTGCKFSPEEERVVMDLQAQFGNRWARIATYLPGRTDNDVKNFWSTRQKRLARILRAPLLRKRATKQSCTATTSAPSHELPDQKPLRQGPCLAMVRFQETTTHHVGQSSSQESGEIPFHARAFQETTHHVGQSSSQVEPRTEHQCADAPFPGAYGGLPPSPVALPTRAAAEGGGGSPSAAPADRPRLPFGGVDPLAFVDPDDEFPDAAYLEASGPFFSLHDEYGHYGSALHRSVAGVRFDDLSPETVDFFELPHLPPSSRPPFPPQSSQL